MFICLYTIICIGMCVCLCICFECVTVCVFVFVCVHLCICLCVCSSVCVCDNRQVSLSRSLSFNCLRLDYQCLFPCPFMSYVCYALLCFVNSLSLSIANLIGQVLYCLV